MDTVLVDWQIRPYREGDAAMLAATWTETFKADGIDEVVTEQELLTGFHRPDFDPAWQVLVVEGPKVEGLPEGLVPGFGWLDIKDHTDASLRFYGPRVNVHPAARSLGLEWVLARRLLQMAFAHENDPATAQMEEVRVREIFSPRQESQMKLYEELGMFLVRVYWTMERSLDDLPEAKPVEGVVIRPYRLPEDNVEALLAYTDAFADQFGSQPPTLEAWVYRMESPATRLDLSWLAEVPGHNHSHPDRIVGFCICQLDEEGNRLAGRKEGWIDLIGTVPAWRGKGLGRSLLLHGLHSLKSAGMEMALLGVDAESPTGATAMYETVGFRVRDEWLRYECLLSKIRI